VAGARIDQGAIEIEEEATALTEEFGKVGDQTSKVQ
jgi:DNA anti-recombination protein RmuC